MLDDAPDTIVNPAQDEGIQSQAEVSIGVVATRLADALLDGDVLYIAVDEQRAEGVAAALRCAMPQAQVIHAPSSDALPGETGAASPANVGRRVAALRDVRVAQARADHPALAFITTAEAAAAGYPPPGEFDHAPPVLAVGDELDAEGLANTLAQIGYLADDRVDEPGEMAVRGQVIDLFPADSASPVRIDFQNERIVAIRCYDPVSQLGRDALDHIEVGRIVEPAVGSDFVTLFDHLPEAAVAIDRGAAARRDRYVALAQEVARGRIEPKVAGAKAWANALGKRREIDIATPLVGDVPRFVESKAPMRAFARFAEAALAHGTRVVILGAQRDLRFLVPRIGKALGAECKTIAAWRDIPSLTGTTVGLLAMPVDRGWQSDGLAVIAAADLLGGRALGDREAAATTDTLRGELGDIRIGDVVVHEDFGIGRIAGIEPMATGDLVDEAGDAIVLEYAGGARRMVSVDEADRLWRYGADAHAVTLDKLDGSSWETRRIAIDATIAETARGLTLLAAERDRRTATPLKPDTDTYERFSTGFAFTETADQARAIATVRSDLAAGKPMDRLVVGDVGYGKTEVALRAAAIAALAGKQVVVAAPTTVLVRQHLDVFRRRFADTGVTVAGLSRLSSAGEKKAVKAGLLTDRSRSS